jgi:hypothetical protein
MEIKIAKERISIQKIEKVLDILVNGKKVTIVKWHFFEESEMLDDGFDILDAEAYGELEDDERDALNDFVDNLKL